MVESTVLISTLELEQEVSKLDGWIIADDQKSIERTFDLGDFVHAFSFMTAVALHAEKVDHHPDWCNSWNKVKVSLQTHVAGGVTQSDIELAAFMNKAFAEHSRP